MFEKGDAVRAIGKLKKVVDFLSDADKETLRILASFFSEDAKGSTDAKRFKKPVLVRKVYSKDQTVEVEVSKTFVWEEKMEYFEKVEVPEEDEDTIGDSDPSVERVPE